MEVGFVGLGNMGQPMARNLLKAGHSVIAFNRTRSRAEDLVPEGAIVAGSPVDVARAEVVITMLADDDAVESVVPGEHGFQSRLNPGAVHVSMSTISVGLSEKLRDLHASAGQGYLAAPVFGRPDAAAAGKLFVVVAGPDEIVQRCQPLFDAIGQKTFGVGQDPPGANVVKLAGNFMIASMLESLAETFTLIKKHGVDPAGYLEVLTGTLFGAPAYKNYGALILEERFSPPGFKLPLGLKDVKLALAAGEDVACPLPVASLIRDRFLSAIARGYGDLDWSALALVAGEDAGLKPGG